MRDGAGPESGAVMGSARTRSQDVIGLIGFMLLTFAAAAVGSIASARAGAFYAQLERPIWAPPGWLFAPVWGLLYLSMGVAAWLVWRQASRWRTVAPAMTVYIVQLATNALWTWLFFAWRQGAWAFAEVILLAALVAVTMAAFRRHSATAALLLIPYLAWVLFATALTFTVWRMNPGLLA